MNKETIHIENLSIGYPGKGDVKRWQTAFAPESTVVS